MPSQWSTLLLVSTIASHINSGTLCDMEPVSNTAGQCLLFTGARVMYRLHPDSREKVIGILTSLPDKKCSLKV